MTHELFCKGDHRGGRVVILSECEESRGCQPLDPSFPVCRQAGIQDDCKLKKGAYAKIY